MGICCFAYWAYILPSSGKSTYTFLPWFSSTSFDFVQLLGALVPGLT